jgi:hypothetical protein
VVPFVSRIAWPTISSDVNTAARRKPDISFGTVRHGLQDYVRARKLYGNWDDLTRIHFRVWW